MTSKKKIDLDKEYDRLSKELSAEVLAKRKSKKETKKMSKLNSKFFAVVEAVIIGGALILALGFWLGLNYTNAQKKAVNEQAKVEASAMVAQLKSQLKP